MRSKVAGSAKTGVSVAIREAMNWGRGTLRRSKAKEVVKSLGLQARDQDRSLLFVVGW